ncbi:hypothetical protein C1H71_03680 [Iodobacter fluviatilis]|jgi:predicted metalloprotease|uniref:Uncharacterized protein n=1 Tax=Iodobacter fluviatilis TaxID=537 RepID=A0A7G3G5K6_9NEIS|nr:hypothetical protein C1H71_03680 [Iodobacter fluviatilis]
MKRQQTLGLLANHNAPTHRNQSTQAKVTTCDDPASQFARAILASTEDVWSKAYPEAFGNAYKKPTLVLFRDQVNPPAVAPLLRWGHFIARQISKFIST